MSRGDGVIAGVGGIGCLIMGVAFLSMFPAWLTHVIFCIRHHDWLFLIAGALAFPIAVVHGWGIWFHWWG